MLPAGWEAEKTPQGEMYFVDHNNGTTSWEDPRPLPVGFEAKKDGSGRTYFIDHRNKRTQWEDPRPPLQIGQGHLEPATEQMQPTLQQIPSGLFSRPHRRTSLLSKNNDLLSQPSETDGNSQLLVKPTVKEQPANLRCTNNPTCSQDHPLEATETFSEDYTLPTWNCDECKSSFPKQLRWSCQICLYDICTLCYCNPEGTQKEKDAVPDCSSDLKVEIPQSNVQPFPAAVISIKYSLERVTSATARSSMSSRLSAGLLRGRRLSTPEDDEDHETKSSSGPLKKGLTISSVDIAGVSADFSGRGLLDKDIKFIASELKGCNFVPKSGLLGKNTCSLCKRAKKHHPLSSSLTHLDLSGMKIVSKTAGKLADAILVNKTLTSLNYKDCSQMARVGIDAMTKAVCAREPPFNNFSGIPISKMVQNDQTIQVLDFRGQNLGNVELCVLGHYLVKNSSIKSLDIRGSGLVGRSAAYCLVESVVGRSDAMEVFSGIPIKQLLQNNPEITSCNLENSGCGNAEAFMLAHCLEINSTLVRLNLAKNPAISVAGYERLAFALAANSSLQALEIDSVNSSWLHTAKTLVQLNGDVKQINLAEVHLESDQILLIADKVKTAQSIETIDFTCKKMGSNLPLSIWQTFALSALECQSFRTLIIKGEIPVDKFRMKCDVIDLSGQRMKDRGAAVVATLLQNSSVTTLILNDCAINDEGANHLAEAIQFNVFLRVLKLGSNNIGKVGMNSFVNVFKTNKTLQELHLESQKSKAKNVAMARNSPLLGLAAVLRVLA